MPLSPEHASRRVVVTDGAGLIGSAITRLLTARGHVAIGCDLAPDVRHGRDSECEVLDVAASNLGERLGRCSPDVVVHCAAHPGGRSLEEPSADVRVNAFGSMQVFEWCARAGVPVVYLSSSAVYGEQPAAPIPETAPLRPGTVYATCKVACEDFLHILGAGRGLQWTTLRLFATYGPGHRPSTFQGIVNVLLTQLLAGNRVVVRGSLERMRDLLYVDDAAAAVIACLFEPRVRGRVFNVGTGRATGVGELLQRLCALLDRPLSDVAIVEEAGTPGDPLYSVADASALRAAIGFVPTVPLAEGLARLVAARRSPMVAAEGTDR